MSVNPTGDQRPKTASFSREGLGIAAVLLLSGIITVVATELSPTTIGTVIGGGLAGLVVGLLPYFVGRRRNLRVAQVCLWLCVAAGALGGAIIALPLAVVLLIVAMAIPRDNRNI